MWADGYREAAWRRRTGVEDEVEEEGERLGGEWRMSCV